MDSHESPTHLDISLLYSHCYQNSPVITLYLIPIPIVGTDYYYLHIIYYHNCSIQLLCIEQCSPWARQSPARPGPGPWAQGPAWTQPVQINDMLSRPAQARCILARCIIPRPYRGGVGATPPLRFFTDSEKTAARSAAGFWATLWGKPSAIFSKKNLTGSGQVTEL